jgi:hypothetical protein
LASVGQKNRCIGLVTQIAWPVHPHRDDFDVSIVERGHDRLAHKWVCQGGLNFGGRVEQEGQLQRANVFVDRAVDASGWRDDIHTTQLQALDLALLIKQRSTVVHLDTGTVTQTGFQFGNEKVEGLALQPFFVVVVRHDDVCLRGGACGRDDGECQTAAR